MPSGGWAPSSRASGWSGRGWTRTCSARPALDQADVFLAVTQGDNTNIFAAQIAREVFGVERVVARIYDPIRAQAYRELGITTLCTTTLAAGLIYDAAFSADDSAVAAGRPGVGPAYLEQRGYEGFT